DDRQLERADALARAGPASGGLRTGDPFLDGRLKLGDERAGGVGALWHAGKLPGIPVFDDAPPPHARHGRLSRAPAPDGRVPAASVSVRLVEDLSQCMPISPASAGVPT